MLTNETLKKMMIELLELNEIGCTYDFTERFQVSLKSLEALKLTKVIRSRIPACGDHCENYSNCKWIPVFESRKSKSKFKLTKNGLSLANFLLTDIPNEEVLNDAIMEQIAEANIVAILLSSLETKGSLEVEELITNLLDKTNLKINTIRLVAQDILDLLKSMQLIQQLEGVIVKCE